MQKRIVSFVIVAILCLLSEACNEQPESCGNVMQPPAVYDHAPVNATLVREYPKSEVAAACEALGTEPDRWACSRGGFIIIPAIGPGVTYHYQMCLLHHEWGHDNGWPGDHRGGRTI